MYSREQLQRNGQNGNVRAKHGNTDHYIITASSVIVNLKSVGSRTDHNYQRLPKSRSSHGGQQIHDYYEDLHLSHINAEWEEKAESTVRISDVDQQHTLVLTQNAFMSVIWWIESAGSHLPSQGLCVGLIPTKKRAHFKYTLPFKMMRSLRNVLIQITVFYQ